MEQTGKVLYTAKAHTTGGRDGVSKTDDGRLDVQLSSPGTAGKGTNPEQLFATGWSACFLGAMAVAARKSEVQLPKESAIDAEIELVSGGEANFFLRARMNISIPGVGREKALQIIDLAHTICPYSKATAGNIEVKLNLV